MPGRCDVCKTPCAGDLCAAHEQVLRERPDENPGVMRLYAESGLDRLALSLVNHERFAAWLRTHEEEPMSEKCVKHVTYKTDDDKQAFAFVLSTNENGSLNLAVLDPDNYTLHAANEVPADSDRLS